MVKKKTRRKGSKRTLSLNDQIFKLFKRSPKKRLNARQIIKKLKLSENVDAVNAHLDKLKKNGQITQLGNGKYKLLKVTKDKKMITAEGRVDMTRRGSAYIICDGLESDIFVAPKNLGSAFHGDIVRVQFIAKPDRSRHSGKVLEVLERAADSFIGTLHLSPKFAFVVVSDERIPVDIFVPTSKTKEAKNGEKVIVKVTQWHDGKGKSPSGIITTVLGEAGSNEIEMKSILIQNGFNLEFPDAVMEEAKALKMKVTEKELARRRDFREITTFTIDPETAKDFDDALSIQYLENGNCEIGVHIADVTHFLAENSALDKEAYKRSTSVYLVDRCLPMLPERLSNDLCSLNPQEEKFCFSAVFTFDKNKAIVDRWFGKTIIFSDRRFTYEEAQTVIETGEGDYAAELKKMNQLAYKLRKAKFKNGAINFDAPEVKFKLDDEGKPIDVYVKERKDAHLLVEDFMLLANREVATYMYKKKEGQEIPFVYRVHDLPEPEKVADFALFAAELGYPLKIDTPKQIAKSFNQLVKAAEEREELKMLLPLAIRTMSKATYQPENIGHYGLAFDNYTHFTSPIRRYSDVLVHRILYKNLEKPNRTNLADLEMQCVHISKMERKAMEAERESIKYKQTEYLKDQVGAEFEGVISGMIERGLFVQITQNSCEGMVTFDRLEESFYLEGRFKAIGKRTGKIFKMGDTVKVKVLEVDMERKRVEMDLVE